MGVLFGVLFAMNGLAFGAMGWDKRRAQRGERRIPEKTLFLLAALGGGAGALAGMYAFRHKTKHPSFVWGLPAIFAAQIGIALWLAKG